MRFEGCIVSFDRDPYLLHYSDDSGEEELSEHEFDDVEIL